MNKCHVIPVTLSIAVEDLDIVFNTFTIVRLTSVPVSVVHGRTISPVPLAIRLLVASNEGIGWHQREEEVIGLQIMNGSKISTKSITFCLTLFPVQLFTDEFVTLVCVGIVCESTWTIFDRILTEVSMIIGMIVRNIIPVAVSPSMEYL